MKFDTTLILAAFSLSAAVASDDGKLIRGGGAVVVSELPNVPQDNKAEVVMTAKRNVRVGGNIYKTTAEVNFEELPSQYCTKTSCDDPCGSTTPFAIQNQTICEMAANTHLAKRCEEGKECEPCPGMHLKYICKDPSVVDTTKSAPTNTNTTNTNTTDTPGLSQW
jgi:hypothetical protein